MKTIDQNKYPFKLNCTGSIVMNKTAFVKRKMLSRTQIFPFLSACGSLSENRGGIAIGMVQKKINIQLPAIKGPSKIS
jgi:hypothetical protein